MQAVVSGAQSILLGESNVVLAGGIESMSRMPYLIDSADARWGHRMGNFTLVDAMYRDGFQCPLSNLIMGETAEVLAGQYGISRDQSDCFALESQKKAAAAIAGGHFTREIAPVTITVKGAPVTVDRDEHPRDTTIETLRKLPLAFPKVEGETGIITPGTASGVTDGGAALVLTSAETARQRGLRPRARILGWASAGVDPRIMAFDRSGRLADQSLAEVAVVIGAFLRHFRAIITHMLTPLTFVCYARFHHVDDDNISPL